MKNFLLFFCLILGIYQAKAQIIITGFYTEPPHDDAPVTGGFEYMQFMATEAIDFSANNYCVMIAGNNGQLVTADGWAGSPSNTNHLKFNLTQGTVAKGEFFYVGNIKKQINGTLNGVPSTDISSANWIRTINTGLVNGDDNIGIANIVGFLPQAANSACGIAVFSGTTILNTTVPIDAVFYGGNIGQSNYVAPDKGYLTPVNNGFYNDGGGTQKYFGQGTNTTLVGPKSASNDNQFYMMGGNYNTATGVWTGRVGTRVKLTATSTLADIQTGAITTLPVELVSFSGKNQNNGVLLNWATASEKNNSYFDILHSSDGINFKTIGTQSGSGNSDAVNAYSFTDAYPFAGINYYQLNQVDHNGLSEKSKVIAITTNLEQQQFKISQTVSNQTTATIYATETANAQIRITDITGRTLLNTTIQLEKGQNQFNMPTSAIKQGIYVATLFINHKNTSSIKFIK